MNRTSRAHSRRTDNTANENAGYTAKTYYANTRSRGDAKGAVAGAKKAGSRTRRALGEITNRGSSNYSHTTKASKCESNKASTAAAAASTRPTTERKVADTDAGSAPSTARDGKLEFAVDRADAKNPQCATEYVQDMYQNYRKAEGVRAPNPNYMSKQTDISEKMRAILLDWLVEVHLKFKFEMPTLYLTVNIIDRFLERKIVLRQKLQLVGVTAMLLASKYEEMCAPEVADFVYLTDRAYTAEEILACESTMLNTLSFRLSVPTIWVFLCRFVKLAGLNDRKSYLLARYYAERTLQEYKMLKYLPSTIAASAVYMALKVTHGTARWSSEMHRGTKYSEATLKPCVTDMVSIINNSSNTSLQAIRKKYSSHRYLRVAKLTLPSFD